MMVLPADTLLYDSAKIAEYQADKRFDYNSQLGMPEFDLMGMIQHWINRMLQRFFSYEASQVISTWLLVAFFLLVVGFVIYFIYRNHPELFLRDKKNPSLRYDVEEETIYGIDFEKEMSAALSAGDYRSAIRFLYLQTLRFIADKEWIEWRIYKTPTEYMSELKPAELKPPFRDFTNHFLQVRYGNFKATGELFKEMCDLQKALKT
ncbi:MAG: DUF4129 domain-containing protein, partial [Tannerella sp.]|nr:DUF4129 domain-containing protein [Tannerella sp.]